MDREQLLQNIQTILQFPLNQERYAGARRILRNFDSSEETVNGRTKLAKALKQLKTAIENYKGKKPVRRSIFNNPPVPRNIPRGPRSKVKRKSPNSEREQGNKNPAKRTKQSSVQDQGFNSPTKLQPAFGTGNIEQPTPNVAAPLYIPSEAISEYIRIINQNNNFRKWRYGTLNFMKSCFKLIEDRGLKIKLIQNPSNFSRNLFKSNILTPDNRNARPEVYRHTYNITQDDARNIIFMFWLDGLHDQYLLENKVTFPEFYSGKKSYIGIYFKKNRPPFRITQFMVDAIENSTMGKKAKERLKLMAGIGETDWPQTANPIESSWEASIRNSFFTPDTVTTIKDDKVIVRQNNSDNKYLCLTVDAEESDEILFTKLIQHKNNGVNVVKFCANNGTFMDPGNQMVKSGFRNMVTELKATNASSSPGKQYITGIEQFDVSFQINGKDFLNIRNFTGNDGNFKLVVNGTEVITSSVTKKAAKGGDPRDEFAKMMGDTLQIITVLVGNTGRRLRNGISYGFATHDNIAACIAKTLSDASGISFPIFLDASRKTFSKSGGDYALVHNFPSNDFKTIQRPGNKQVASMSTNQQTPARTRNEKRIIATQIKTSMSANNRQKGLATKFVNSNNTKPIVNSTENLGGLLQTGKSFGQYVRTLQNINSLIDNVSASLNRTSFEGEKNLRSQYMKELSFNRLMLSKGIPAGNYDTILRAFQRNPRETISLLKNFGTVVDPGYGPAFSKIKNIANSRLA